MIYFLLLSGLRRGEFVALRVMDIDFDKNIITVRRETSKSKRTRYVPLHRTISLHLKEYIKERNLRNYKTEYLWGSENKDDGLTKDGLKHWVNKLRTFSGVRFHLHQFRHTFACNLFRQETDIVTIQKLMGHTSIKMTVRYLRSLGLEDFRGELDKLNIDNFRHS